MGGTRKKRGDHAVLIRSQLAKEKASLMHPALMFGSSEKERGRGEKAKHDGALHRYGVNTTK